MSVATFELKDVEIDLEYLNSLVKPMTDCCSTTTTTAVDSCTISSGTAGSPYYETITTTTTPYYYPATTTTITPSAITINTSSITDKIEEKIKDYTEKTDLHVDKLEEDIQFLDEKRQENEIKIDELLGQVTAAHFKLGEKDKKIKDLEDQVNNLKGLVSWLEDTILKIQEKMEYDKEVCQETNPS